MAAKNKKKASRQGIVSKVMNIGLITLAFIRPIWLLWTKGAFGGAGEIIRESTFGLSQGKFDLQAGLSFYTPVGASVTIGYMKSYLLRKFPVRR